jgi:WD40 repeat protein
VCNQLLVMGGFDGVTKVYNLEGPTSVATHTLDRHTMRVNDVQCDRVKVWSVYTGFHTFNRALQCITGGADNALQVWPLNSPSPRALYTLLGGSRDSASR